MGRVCPIWQFQFGGSSRNYSGVWHLTLVSWLRPLTKLVACAKKKQRLFGYYGARREIGFLENTASILLAKLTDSADELGISVTTLSSLIASKYQAFWPV